MIFYSTYIILWYLNVQNRSKFIDVSQKKADKYEKWMSEPLKLKKKL